MKYLLLVLLTMGCTGHYKISSKNQRGDLGFANKDEALFERKTIELWSYFGSYDKGEAILPYDIGFNNRDISHLKIKTYYTLADLFWGVIPFAQRRHIDIFYSDKNQEDGTMEGP